MSTNKQGIGAVFVIVVAAISLFLTSAYMMRTSTSPTTDIRTRAQEVIQSMAQLNTTGRTSSAAIPSTGNGGLGYQGFVQYANDCTNGYAAAAAYSPATAYYGVVEMADSTAQAGLGKGRLVGQARLLNNETFYDSHPAWESVGGGGSTVRFYVYTVMEDTVPETAYTIHGVDGAGNLVSANATEPPPQPFVLTCPADAQPPPQNGEYPPTTDQPPVVGQPPADVDSTTKQPMSIKVRIFIPTAAGGVEGNTPYVTTLPVDVLLTNASRTDDNESVTITMTYGGAGVWEGSYATSHYPGTQFAVTVWPKLHTKKTLCSVGALSPHATLATYECTEKQGAITLVAGANTVDFTNIKLGSGDLNVDAIRDGHVDSSDLYQLNEFIKRPSRDQLDAADINLDGVIDQKDYDLAVWSLQNVRE